MMSLLLDRRVYFSVIIAMNVMAAVGAVRDRNWTRIAYQVCVVGLNVCIGWGKMS